MSDVAGEPRVERRLVRAMSRAIEDFRMIDEGDRMAGVQQPQSTGQADHSGADNENLAARRLLNRLLLREVGETTHDGALSARNSSSNGRGRFGNDRGALSRSPRQEIGDDQ